MFNKKIITVAVSAVLILALAGVGIYGVVSSDDGKDSTSSTAEAPSSQVSSGGEEIPDSSVTAFKPESELSKLILGKWTDSANMSGYEFFMDGTVQMTYVNLTVPIINIPINGTSKGVYTLDGDRLTTKFSIYSATIEDTFIVSVENNILSMYNIEEGETATYSKDTSTTVTTQQSNTVTDEAEEVIDGLEFVGSWINSDGSIAYKFNKDGTVKITIDGEEFSGVYLSVEDKITLQYAAGKRKITEEYKYTVSKNSLSLDDGKDVILFSRKGTSIVPSTADNSLLGIWRDGADMSGYEFLEGGVAKVTFVNFTIPVINMPINGTFTGSYSVDGDKLTVNYSIYGNSITDVFTFSVKDNVLSLKDSDGETATYLKK